MFDFNENTFDDPYNDFPDLSLTPEQLAEVEALQEKKRASTTTLDVSMEEYLDSLRDLSIEALDELFTDRAFNQWKTKLEYSYDGDLIHDVLTFVAGRHDAAQVERKTLILQSLCRNSGLDGDHIQELLGLSSTYGFAYESMLARQSFLTEAQALFLVRGNDDLVLAELAHNPDVPHVALKAIAGMKPMKVSMLSYILNNPTCTPEIRRVLDADAVRMFDDLQASRLSSITNAGEGDELWKTYDVTNCFVANLVAALNPTLPYDISSAFEVMRDEVGAVARYMVNTEQYTYLQYEDDDDIENDDDD